MQLGDGGTDSEFVLDAGTSSVRKLLRRGGAKHTMPDLTTGAGLGSGTRVIPTVVPE